MRWDSKVWLWIPPHLLGSFRNSKVFCSKTLLKVPDSSHPTPWNGESSYVGKLHGTGDYEGMGFFVCLFWIGIWQISKQCYDSFRGTAKGSIRMYRSIHMYLLSPKFCSSSFPPATIIGLFLTPGKPLFLFELQLPLRPASASQAHCEDQMRWRMWMPCRRLVLRH